MDDRGEVCFEEAVERLWRSGMSATEIADQMGVDPVWVSSLISLWSDEDAPAMEREV